MTIELYLMLWLTTLVFTIASFIWKEILFFPILSFVLWNVLALLSGDITYVGFGSQAVIAQTYEGGDPEIGYSLIYLMHGIGVMMLLYGFGNLWGQARKDINDGFSGKRRDTI
jgi:hypothetical protein